MKKLSKYVKTEEPRTEFQFTTNNPWKMMTNDEIQFESFFTGATKADSGEYEQVSDDPFEKGTAHLKREQFTTPFKPPPKITPTNAGSNNALKFKINAMQQAKNKVTLQADIMKTKLDAGIASQKIQQKAASGNSVSTGDRPLKTRTTKGLSSNPARAISKLGRVSMPRPRNEEPMFPGLQIGTADYGKSGPGGSKPAPITNTEERINEDFALLYESSDSPVGNYLNGNLLGGPGAASGLSSGGGSYSIPFSEEDKVTKAKKVSVKKFLKKEDVGGDSASYGGSSGEDPEEPQFTRSSAEKFGGKMQFETQGVDHKKKESSVNEEDDAHDHLHASLSKHYKFEPEHIGHIKSYTDHSKRMAMHLVHHAKNGSEPKVHMKLAHNGRGQTTSIHDFDKVVSHHKTPHEMHVYTGLGKNRGEALAHHAMKNKKDHFVVHHPAHISTSLSKERAAGFAADSGHMVHIHVPKGSKGAYIAHHSHVPGEREFVMPRSSHLKFQRHPTLEKHNGKDVNVWHATVHNGKNK